MRNTSPNAKQSQRGMVLAVALILLVILTVIGIAAMQSGALQERMAVNQVQLHGTFIDSEQRVWDSAECIRRQYWDETIQEAKAPESKAFVESHCGFNGAGLARAGAEGANVEWTVPDPDDPGESFYTVSAMEDTFSAGAVSPIVFHVFTPGRLPGGPFSEFPRLSPYVCFGELCEMSVASGRSSPTADGFNRLSPDFEDNADCGARGSNRPVVDDEVDLAVPGLIMPEGTIDPGLTEGSDPNKTPADDVTTSSDPAIINFSDTETEQREDYYETLLAYTDGETEGAYNDYKEYIDAFIDSVIKDENGDLLRGVLTGTRQIEGNETGVFLASAGETITLSSGTEASGGVIVLDGGTLDVTGNQCFAGVVLYRNSGIITSARGTSAFLGTVMGYTGFSSEYMDEHGVTDEDARVMNPRLNGTPSFYFSDKAILDAEEAAARLRGGLYFEMLKWRAPVRRLES